MNYSPRRESKFLMTEMKKMGEKNDRINRNYRCDKKFPLQNGRMTLLIDL